MATHAPSLRVCVYTGWKTLLEGVDRRTNSDAKERKAKDKAKRKKENDRVRAQTVQKYRKNASGNRVKMESDYSDMDSDDEDEDDDELGESLQQRTQKLFVDYVRAHDVVIATYK
jgi:E3 ubiquitin-protein ligase SHPRH